MSLCCSHWPSSWAGPYWTVTPMTGWTVWSGGKRLPRRCSCVSADAPRLRCRASWSVGIGTLDQGFFFSILSSKLINLTTDQVVTALCWTFFCCCITCIPCWIYSYHADKGLYKCQQWLGMTNKYFWQLLFKSSSGRWLKCNQYIWEEINVQFIWFNNVK